MITKSQLYRYAEKTILLLLLIGIAACGVMGSDSDNQGVSKELFLEKPVSGAIAKVGQIDWYHFRAAENKILEIRLKAPARSEVEFLIAVYEENEAGQKKRLYSEHAPLKRQAPVDLNFNLYIEHSKNIAISVRDLMDDESCETSYTLKARYVGAPDGNQNFASAVTIPVNTDSAAIKENIGYIGDVDCFQFKVERSGIYDLRLSFKPSSGNNDMDLSVKLFNAEGALIESRAGLVNNACHIRTCLSGPDAVYYVVVEESGNNAFSTSSYYQISAQSVAVAEALGNDRKEQALLLTPTPGIRAFQGMGALDYTSSNVGPDHSGDMDWYRMDIGTQNDSEPLQALNIVFNNNSINEKIAYRIRVEDETGATLFSLDLKGTETVYRNRIKAGRGAHYLMVGTPEKSVFSQSAVYNFSVQFADIDDFIEENGGNDSKNRATSLLPGEMKKGKIAFKGDVDWYRLDWRAASSRILELFLKSDASQVDYVVELRSGDAIIKKRVDADGTDGKIDLKTSLLIPPAAAGSEPYYIRVADREDDDGDAAVYELIANLREIPDSLPGGQVDGAVRYYNEINEQKQSAVDAENVELEVFSNYQPSFKADRNYLNFRNVIGGVTWKSANGLVLIEMPWVGGYIDYQGDRDFFQIDLGPLYPDNPDSHYFYDIQVRMISPSRTDVEYVWKFYRDNNGNAVITDDPMGLDGYFACDGDRDPQNDSAINVRTRGNEKPFFAGDLWSMEGARFYFGVQDFNYIRLPSGGLNPLPDDDWGYAAPYYFKISLVYHSGKSKP